MKPTVGRVVWYYKGGKAQHDAGVQPLSAQVSYVHSDDRINIGYLETNGAAGNACSVRLLAPGEAMPDGPFCCWMPYQVGQAQRTADAERVAAAVRAGYASP